MKKLLLLMAAALLLPVSLGAQLVKAPATPRQLLEPGYSFQAPAAADLAENQKIMGHYDTDDYSTNGLGMTSSPGVIPLGVILEPDELAVFQGGKIVAFRVALAASTPVTRVFVIPVSADGVFGTTTAWECNVNKVGWNVIELETPYEINLAEDEQLMIGFDYEQTASNYPISAVQVGKLYDAYRYTKVSPRVYEWRAVGLINYGNLSVQCIVESDNYPDYMFSISDLTASNYIQSGDNLNFSFNVKNNGVKKVDAESLSFDVMIDGEKVATVTNADDIIRGYYNINGNVATEGLTSGAHTLGVTLVSMNGEPLEPQTLEYSFKVISNTFPRQKHIVEQLTSTYCTYCPLGISMLKVLTSKRDDLIWVGLHGNMGGVDPFRSDQCDSLLTYLTGGAVSYPSGAFDRAVGLEDDGSIATSLGYYEQYHQQVANELSSFLDYVTEQTPNFATINGECILPSEGTPTVTIYGDLTPDFDIMMGEDAKLTVYILEDSLIAPQLNLGTWVEDFMHNGVFRCALGSVLGVPLNKTGVNQYSNKFEVELPEEIEDLSHLRVVAFISRPLSNARFGFSDVYITNAEEFNFSYVQGGVEELLLDEDAVPVGYYDVTGRQHDSLQQGVNIVKMSNGKAKKILVK